MKALIVKNLKAKLHSEIEEEVDEMEKLRQQIGQNLRERFNRDHENKVDGEVEKHYRNESNKHNATKNATHAKHNETKKNGTHENVPKHEKKEEHPKGPKVGENEDEHQFNGHRERLGKKNESHPDGPMVGGDEDEQYYNFTKFNQTEEAKNRTLFLAAVESPELTQESVSFPWYYSVLISAAGFAFLAFVVYMTKKFCLNKEQVDEDFHHVGSKKVSV